MRAVLRFACLIGVMYSGPAAAEPSKIVGWLMDRPLTLWDMGMIRVEQAAEKAARAAPVKKASRPVTVKYDFDRNKIDILFSARVSGTQATPEKCNEVRRTFIADMASIWRAAPDDLLLVMVKGAVSDWFSHKGFKSAKRPKNIGDRMAEIIHVLVTIVDDERNAFWCAESIVELDGITERVDLSDRKSAG